MLVGGQHEEKGIQNPVSNFDCYPLARGNVLGLLTESPATKSHNMDEFSNN